MQAILLSKLVMLQTLCASVSIASIMYLRGVFIVLYLNTARYGEPTVLAGLGYRFRRVVSFLFSLLFVVVLLVAASSLKFSTFCAQLILRTAPPRPFLHIEQERHKSRTPTGKVSVLDAAYYASIVGLHVEKTEVITSDGFVLAMLRVIDPKDTASERTQRAKYPVLLVHGLMGCAGVFFANEEDSLAFVLCKSGYDVWISNNRGGVDHKHKDYKYNDPRSWEWDVTDMATKDLPAFVDYVLAATGHDKLALVCHSQGGAQTFLALSRKHCPDLGLKISVFCALGPAVYAGPEIDRIFFKLVRYLPHSVYDLIFGIHAFIPLVITIKPLLPAWLLSSCGFALSYFLFHWSNRLWDRAMGSRMFQFIPVYTSAECLRWWLGRGGFSSKRCIFDSTEEPWFDERCPPVGLWIGGSDTLVDGNKLLERLESEPHVSLVAKSIIEPYDHMDLLWAIDVPEKVGTGVKETIWATAWNPDRFVCPDGCEELQLLN
ncbi:Alpha/Beta hydrolase protein [Limtongia smithiae]|uniref:Alpha/Beta hydrolase protein n=1 Tax=Limtongia smithiae TaxID=1125753 RepID=UPI0034CF3448